MQNTGRSPDILPDVSGRGREIIWCFFPSYRLMEDVLQVYEEEFSVDWVRCVCQTPDMTEQEREGFLEEFQEREGTLVGFCVLGGFF